MKQMEQGHMRKLGNLLVSFFVRGIIGMLAVYFLDEACVYYGFERICVGLNPYSGLTCATLGFPGVAALFGIMAVKFL